MTEQDKQRYRVRALVEFEIDKYVMATDPAEAVGLVKLAVAECVYGPGSTNGHWSEVDVELE